MNAHPVHRPKAQSELNGEWDLIADDRHRQISTGIDVTYCHVLAPRLLALCAPYLDGGTVLDVGCGTGDFSRRLADSASLVVGVDPSKRSIEIAQSQHSLASLQFYSETLEAFSEHTESKFSLAVANMTLMDCLDLGRVIKSISHLLKPTGALAFTITHPWNWPLYWGYHDAPWFDYKSEIAIEAPFRISAESTEYVTTHIHRPLEMYMCTLASNGFVVDQLIEPVPVYGDQSKPWQYPRYLAVRAIKLDVP